MKLLIIEDDDGIREMLNLVLNYEGYEVISSVDGAILDRVPEINPDVILIDEWLCTEKGSDLCKKLKANPETATIPVIMVSALVTIEEFSKQAGADGFIRKPFDLDVLNNTIKKYI